MVTISAFLERKARYLESGDQTGTWLRPSLVTLAVPRMPVIASTYRLPEKITIPASSNEQIHVPPGLRDQAELRQRETINNPRA